MRKKVSVIIALMLMIVMVLTSAAGVCAEPVSGIGTEGGTDPVAAEADGQTEGTSADAAEAGEQQEAASEAEAGEQQTGTAAEESSEAGGQQDAASDVPASDGEQGETAHVHTWSEWTITTEPTYFKDGEQERVCTECGETESETVAKLTARKKWIKDGDKLYYFGKYKVPYTGWHKLKTYKSTKTKWCYFNKKGVLKKTVSKNTKYKWVKADGKKFYFGKKKKPLKEGFHFIGGKLYYMDKNCAMVKGRFKANDGHKYTAAKNGTISGIAYYKYKYGTFVLVDISSQTVKYYKNRKLKLKSDVVTGTKGVHDTPTGVYSIRSKQTNINLVGPTWNSHVNYWMAFIGGSIGLHDASWRTSAQFSNHKTYLSNGSHGCVNLRPSFAKKLYKKVRIGTTVIVQK